MGAVIQLPGASATPRIQKRRGRLPKIATDIRDALDRRRRGEAVAPAEPTALQRLECASAGLALFEEEAERLRQKIRLLTGGN